MNQGQGQGQGQGQMSPQMVAAGTASASASASIKATEGIPHASPAIGAYTIPFLHDTLTEIYELGKTLFPPAGDVPGLDPDVVPAGSKLYEEQEESGICSSTCARTAADDAAVDEFAAKSFQKAAAAQKAGKFKDEIVPLKVKVVDPKTEKEAEIVVDQDDGVRDGVTAQSLAKLKPAFAKDGSTHAGTYLS